MIGAAICTALFEKLIADALRRKAWDRLLSVADRVSDAGIPPMSMEEINAEIKAYRAERGRTVR